MSLTKIKIAFTFFNKFIYPEVRMNMDLLRSYYRNDPYTKSNKLLFGILDIIESTELKDVSRTTLEIKLDSLNQFDFEVSEIISEIIQGRDLEKDQLRPIKEHLSSMCHQAILDNARKNSSTDPTKAVELIKKAEYKSNYSDVMALKKFDELDITDIHSQFLGDGIKSRYEAINNSSPIGAYINGQLVCVVGAPGTGKSLFLMSEAAHFANMGKRVHYMAMGDLNELDFVIRIGAIELKKSLGWMTRNIATEFGEIKQIIKDKICITVVPSKTISCEQYMEYVMRMIDDFDIYMIDYDTNFDDLEMSMYEKGGDTYDRLTALSRMGKLVFIASQPKQHFWSYEVIPIEAAAESSRKQTDY